MNIETTYNNPSFHRSTEELEDQAGPSHSHIDRASQPDPSHYNIDIDIESQAGPSHLFHTSNSSSANSTTQLLNRSSESSSEKNTQDDSTIAVYASPSPGLSISTHHDPCFKLFKGMFDVLMNSTQTSQTFYETEFLRAYKAKKIAFQQYLLDGGMSLDALQKNMQSLEAMGNDGLRFRTARDGISILFSLMVIVPIGIQLADNNFQNFNVALHPTNNAVADSVLTGLEILKAILTTSLTYRTLKNHHAVDEFLERLRAGTDLIKALIDYLAPPIAEAKSSFCIDSIPKNIIEIGSALRHASTIFTVFNYLVAPARVALWTYDKTNLSEDAEHDGGLRGGLRFAASTSDITRAALSLVGTYSRNKTFEIENSLLQQDIQKLMERLQCVVETKGDELIQQLQKFQILFLQCDSHLLQKIKEDPEIFKALCELPFPNNNPKHFIKQ